VLTPESVSVPEPAFVSEPPVPEITPEKVVLLLEFAVRV
jgi:hypothetical protein